MIRFYRIRRRLYFIKRWIKHFYQRRTRGWDDSDTWSLDHTIAKFVLPRLKLFRKIDFGYPAGLTSEEWNWILDEMIWAMEFNASARNGKVSMRMIIIVPKEVMSYLVSISLIYGGKND